MEKSKDAKSFSRFLRDKSKPTGAHVVLLALNSEFFISDSCSFGLFVKRLAIFSLSCYGGATC